MSEEMWKKLWSIMRHQFEQSNRGFEDCMADGNVEGMAYWSGYGAAVRYLAERLAGIEREKEGGDEE